jgi:HEAT repeat protein
MRIRGNILAFVVLGLIVPTWAVGQIANERDISLILSKGSTEEKRDALASIRAGGDVSSATLALISFADRNPVIRATAIGAASNAPTDLLVAELKKLVKDRSIAVRKEAVAALGKLGDSDSAGILRDRLKRERNREVRASIIIGLGLAGSKNDIPNLFSRLTVRGTESNEFERSMSARAIGQIIRRSHGESPVETIPFSFNPISPSSRSEELALSSAEEFDQFEDSVIQIALSAREYVSVRRECAFLLGEGGGTASRIALETLRNDADLYLSRIAEESLLRIAMRSQNTSQ